VDGRWAGSDDDGRRREVIIVYHMYTPRIFSSQETKSRFFERREQARKDVIHGRRDHDQ